MTGLMAAERIENRILLLRGYKVILDSDLADLYQVEVKQLKRQVRRNIDRFPGDFMFELSPQEYESLRRRFGTLKRGEHSKYLPYAFTEQGVAMLSSVLKSKRAAQFKVVFDAIRQLMTPPEPKKRKIGFLISERPAKYRRVG